MKHTAHIFWLALALTLSMAPACDFVDPPYFDSVTLGDCEVGRDCLDKIPADPFAGTPVRKVLFEEFTGHKCVNCPEASEIAHELASQTYKDRAILVSVHATGLAEPDPSSSKYNVDYTTDAGDEYKAFFNIFAVPLGLVNRSQKQGGAYIYTSQEWAGVLNTEFNKAAEAQIHITTCFDEVSRDLEVVADIKYLTDATDQEHYSVWLVEDSIVGWQKDGRVNPQDIENYLFHDVFRGTLNGIWGQSLTEGETVNNGDIFRKAVCYNLPAEYNAKHCKVLVFVHDFTNRTVRQVEEAHVME
ncbi:MAG: Omp28-related outer membrane protein [Bacteroidia bacterium]